MVHLPGDYDGNGQVTGVDLDKFKAEHLAGGPGADVDGSGAVDALDDEEFSRRYTGGLTQQTVGADGYGPMGLRIGYAGYVRDAVTGRWLSRNRWYDAELGRWISRDPAGYVDGLNLYLYVRCNPLGLVDPTGLSGKAPKKNKKTSIYTPQHHHMFNKNFEKRLKDAGHDRDDAAFGRVFLPGKHSKNDLHDKWTTEVEKEFAADDLSKLTKEQIADRLNGIAKKKGNEELAAWLENSKPAKHNYNTLNSMDDAAKAAHFNELFGAAAIERACRDIIENRIVAHLGQEAMERMPGFSVVARRALYVVGVAGAVAGSAQAAEEHGLGYAAMNVVSGGVAETAKETAEAVRDLGAAYYDVQRYNAYYRQQIQMGESPQRAHEHAMRETLDDLKRQELQEPD